MVLCTNPMPSSGPTNSATVPFPQPTDPLIIAATNKEPTGVEYLMNVALQYASHAYSAADFLSVERILAYTKG